jgi:heme o synthase
MATAEEAIRPLESTQFGRVIADYISLTKPGIMVLLLISTLCPMVLAAHGDVTLVELVGALIGGALVSGSASVFNCVFDRDIDAVMERTKNRPLAAGRLAPKSAVIFGTIIGCSGVLIIATLLNPMAALIAVYGHLFYVVIYTIGLKRTTPQNIVIGGAAGAIPPLVGWAGVTGSLNLTALLLFLIIFLWTPPHFWALALNKNSDYKRAGLPMLPVVAGEAATHKQMLLYALALLPVSVWLVLSDELLGSFSMIMLLSLGAVFSWKVFQLKLLTDAEAKTKKAWDVFGFSLIYLGLFFACLVIDSTLV